MNVTEWENAYSPISNKGNYKVCFYTALELCADMNTAFPNSHMWCVVDDGAGQTIKNGYHKRAISYIATKNPWATTRDTEIKIEIKGI
jgi:hypothetical protein